MFSWDIARKIDEQISGAAGLEYAVIKTLAFRAGVSYQKYVDISVGFGAKFSLFTVDYALLPQESLGLSHKISLNVKF